MLMTHDWRSASASVDDGSVQAGSQPAVVVGSRHFAAVLSLALGEVDDARALVHEAGAALEMCPRRRRRSSPR